MMSRVRTEFAGGEEQLKRIGPLDFAEPPNGCWRQTVAWRTVAVLDPCRTCTGLKRAISPLQLLR